MNDDCVKPHALTRIVAWLIARLGSCRFTTVQRLGSGLGWLFRHIPNRNRRIATRNLALCFPELQPGQQRRLLHQHLDQTGRSFTELGWFWSRPKSDLLALVDDVIGVDHLEAALAQGKGCLLAAPHLGAWELLSHWLVNQGDLTLLYREPKQPWMKPILEHGRERSGANAIQADGRAVRHLYRALSSGHVVGILPDQQPKQGTGEYAPFFGRPALTMVLLSRLAVRTGAPIVFGVAERLHQGRGFRIHIEPGDPAIADTDQVLATTALNAQVETLVRRFPAQYQWGYKRFGTTPPGMPDPYA